MIGPNGRRVPQVLHEILERPAPVFVARRLRPPVPSAEAAQRRSAGVIGRHAEPYVLLGLHVDVETDLLVEALLPVAPAEELGEKHQGVSILRTRLTACDRRCQCSSSALSTCRPAAVSA